MASAWLDEQQLAVLDAMHRAGCAPHDPRAIAFDGVRHRFRVAGDAPGSRNGWLILYADRIPSGAFGSWKTGRSETWSAQPWREASAAERRAWRRQWAEIQVRRAAEQRARHDRARARAAKLWERARPFVEARHPYLVAKQAPAVGLRQMKDRLVAPVRDLDGTLHSLAFIGPDGAKRFLKDGAVEGHCHVLGEPQGAKTLLLCEGYATGASLHRASGWPVVVGFNAGNLPPVAARLRRRYPDATLIVAGDDDPRTPGNPGKTYAEQAARAVSGSVVLPDFTGLDSGAAPTDFNDLHVLGGLPRIRAQLLAHRAAQSPMRLPPTSMAPARESGRSSAAPSVPATDFSPRAARSLAMANPRPRPTRRGDEGGGRGDGRRGRGGGASRNLYQEVTDRMIALIENGAAPWRRPWDRPRHPGVPALPFNAATGKPYQGINILLLLASGPGFADPRWCGYQQAQARGWQVAAGARGASVYFFKRLEIDADPDAEPPLDDDGRPLRRAIPLLRRHTVFHASQIEGIPTLEEAYGPTDAPLAHAWDRDAHLEALLRRSGARIVHGGVEAFYRPGTDSIHLPPRERFPASGGYYGVAFHELGHWTGHETRLNRPWCFDRHAPEYAREELRAELASAFLGAELGVHHDLDEHAAYLAMYLELLRQDNKEIFRAAKDAQGIADLLLDRHPEWRLEQGACVRRTEPLPGADSRARDDPDPPAVSPVAIPAPATDAPPPEPNPVAPVAPSSPPFSWVVAALDEARRPEADDSELGQLSRRIEAAFAGASRRAPAGAPAQPAADRLMPNG